MTARTIWVLVLLALAALAMYGMRRGWLNRARRQAVWLPEFPQAPEGVSEEPELLPETTGLYVGTTVGSDWQERIAVGDIGHRADASAHLRRSGLLLQRDGSSPLWIPTESFRRVRVDHKLANKVVPGSGMLVVTWQLGEQSLDTGFRGDDKTRQNEWADAVRALVPAGPSGRDEEQR